MPALFADWLFDFAVPKEILREQYAKEVDEDYQQNMTEAPSAELEEPVEPSEMEARDVPPVDESEYYRCPAPPF